MNLEDIARNYQQLPTFKLSELAKSPEGLTLEAIPVLQKELLNRGEQNDALLLSEYLVNRNNSQPSAEELQQEIKDRLAAGESIESIGLKFKENGIDIFNEIAKEDEIQNLTFDYILSLREKGASESEIEQNLKSNLALDEVEIGIINEKLRVTGKYNLIFGWVLVSLTIIVCGVALAAGGHIGISAFIILGIGVWRIVRGNNLLKR